MKNLPLDIEGPQARSEEEGEEGSEGWGVAAESEAIEGWESVERGGAEESEEDSEGWESEEEGALRVRRMRGRGGRTRMTRAASKRVGRLTARG